MNSSALSFPVPSTLGSLDHYIAAVNRFPVLSREQEYELGIRWKVQQDLDAARQLVLSHLRLVVSVSRNYLGYGLAHADLIQEGNIGLMKAVRRFDAERGVRLVSFALHWIRAEIHEYILRNWRLVKIATTKAQRKLFFNLRSMKSGNVLHSDEARRIARELNVKPEEVFEMEMRIGGQDIALETFAEDQEDRVSPINYLSDPAAEPAHAFEQEQLKRNRSVGLHQALAQLDARSREIIEARWLGSDSAATLQELADKFGVSAERVRQIEQKALKTMRAELDQLGLH